VRIIATILSLVIIVGLSLATQTAAVGVSLGTCRPGTLTRPALVAASDRAPASSNLSDGVPSSDHANSGPSMAAVLDLVWVDSTAAPSPGRYWCPGSGVYRDTIWFLGGRMSAQAATRSMTAYDIVNDQWITTGLPSLTTPRRTGGGGLIGNKIYVAGGKDSSSNILNTCEAFDLDAKTFAAKANMPAAYWAVASAVAGNKLYIIGNEGSTGSTYEYNPAVDSWYTKATLSVGRGWACAAGANGLVYVMGGSDASGTAMSDCWCFDPTANSWTQKAAMPGARTYSTATAYGDSVIYVIGGSADGTTAADSLVYTYHITANAWTTAASRPTSSGWHMTNVDHGVVYVAYGSDCQAPTYLTELNVASWVPPLSHDVTLTAISEPPANMNRGSVKPAGTVRNVGLNAESNIPMTCWIDSSGTRVYSATETVPGPLAPYASVKHTFVTSWTSGPSGAQYTVTMFTALSNDSNRANDTMRANVTITGPGVQESTKPTFILYGASPSLVRGQARISYAVAGPGHVTLGVYDAAGMLARTLVNGQVAPGDRIAVWDRTNNAGRTVAKGTYFYRLTADGRSVSSKAVVIN